MKTELAASLSEGIVEKVATRYPGIHKLGYDQKIIDQRIQDDIEDIVERIGTGEYLLRNFSKKRRFDVTGRMKEFFVYLDSYKQVGKDWREIFSAIELNDSQIVANLCPGWSPKVELGLHYYGFKGVVDICDIDASSAQHIGDFMEIFDSNFHIQQNTKNILTDAIGSYDVIVGNHIIDDLLVGSYTERMGLTLESFYNKEASIILHTQELQTSLWEDINKNVMDKLAIQINDSIKQNGHVVINHYESYVDDIFNNTERFKYVGKMTNYLKENLLAFGYTELPLPNKLSSLYFPAAMSFILKK